MVNRFELEPCDLRTICDPKTFAFKSTARLAPLEGVIGQERAVQAIDFGLNMKSPGYNIFVTGPEGTGKTTIVDQIVTSHAKREKPSQGWVMVNNFNDEFCPIAIAVAAGTANQFKKQMSQLVDGLKKDLPRAFSSKNYEERVQAINKKYQEKQREFFEALDQKAKARGLGINRTQAGFQTFPVVDGEPMKREAFEQLPEEQQTEINARIREIQVGIEEAMREAGKVQQKLQSELEAVMAEVALFVVKARIEALKSNFNDNKGILAYLAEVQQNIVENVNDFLPKPENAGPGAGGDPEAKATFHRYQVNVLVDRQGTDGARVIFESNPNYQNVFGFIEKRAYMGTLMTDYTMVQAGSLLRADGGYLIMEIGSVLMNPIVWETLKRTLQNKKLSIEDISSTMGFGTTSLRPEPIPLDVKVILLGDYQLFHLLQNHDSKFNKIFKVRADFDYEVVRNEETMHQFAQFIARICKEDQLMAVTPTGVAAMVEFADKQADDKNKLSLRFGPIQAILKEADYWARKAGARSISVKHVHKALAERRFRYNLYEEKSHEAIAEETVMIDVKGGVVGQVNALAVYQLGDISFGRPSRITAEAYMGKDGVINIEREAKLSGKTHDKGIMILSGFLGRTFAQRYPLNLSISITFEQSYGGIDGDSASSTELYAILSSLSGLPIDQGIAVTGSVNQKGQVQAIGGVNQKVEGFYEVCRAKGLTGKQGVMIPKANVKNLMVNHSVLRAVEKGRFHIWAVSTIGQGIEILTGTPAGVADKQGRYPEESVYGRVAQRLKGFVARGFELKNEFGGDEE